MHGGAFMFGDLDMPEADWTAREICARAGAVVVSVDYRLAVGGVHHPVPLDDCVAAARWLRDSAAELGVDPTASPSAAPAPAATWPPRPSLRLRDEDGWQPASLIPVYPVLHAALPGAVRRGGGAARRGAAGAALHPRGHRGHQRQLPRRPAEPADGYSFPALADLTGLVPDAAGQRRVRRPAHHRRGLRRPARGRRRRRTPRAAPTACCTASSTSRPTSSPSTRSSR